MRQVSDKSKADSMDWGYRLGGWGLSLLLGLMAKLQIPPNALADLIRGQKLADSVEDRMSRLAQGGSPAPKTYSWLDRARAHLGFWLILRACHKKRRTPTHIGRIALETTSHRQELSTLLACLEGGYDETWLLSRELTRVCDAISPCSDEEEDLRYGSVIPKGGRLSPIAVYREGGRVFEDISANFIQPVCLKRGARG